MTPLQALQILQKEFENNKHGSILNLEDTFICLLREIEVPDFPQDYRFDMVAEKRTNKEKLRTKKRIIK